MDVGDVDNDDGSRQGVVIACSLRAAILIGVFEPNPSSTEGQAQGQRSIWRVMCGDEGERNEAVAVDESGMKGGRPLY